jgi:membrane protease YdiL (CAAX protease family)
MFKKYLRIQPAPVQLIIFLSFWAILFLFAQLATVTYIKLATGVPSDKIMDFIQGDLNKFPNVLFIANAISGIFCFLLPAWLFAYLADPRPAAYLGGKKTAKPIQIVLVVVIALALIFFVSPLAGWIKELNLGSTSKELDEQRDKLLSNYLKSSNTISTIRNIILIAVIPAICEEYFFRGIFMKMLHSFVPKWGFSILVSAMIFAAFHASISEFLPICLAGVVLGMVYYLTSNLYLSILLHLIFNSTQALIGIYANADTDKMADNNAVVIIIFAIAAVVLSVCLYFLFKNKTPLPQHWTIVVPEEIEASEA